MDFVKANYLKIKQAKLLPPTYDILKNGKKEALSIVVDHSCHFIFEIHNESSVLKKDLDHFDLETKMVDDKHPNKYYWRNHASILNVLKKLVEKEISF